MLLYNLVIRLYALVIHLASLKNEKAKFWVAGRDNWDSLLAKKINQHKNKYRVWFHCASLGEFEQGRPLMEAIKKQKPDTCIVLSFFSPSGYEVQKNYSGADVITYLPLDTKKNAERFLDIVNPNQIVFIKYEFWVNFLNAIKKRGIDAYLVSAVFKPHHPFFKWYGKIFINSLKAFKVLFVQDANSFQLISSLNFKNVKISGDTRFDRVIEIKSNFKEIEEVKLFKGKKQLIVAGSTWAGDCDLVLKAFVKLNNQNVKLLIAPHEIDESSIQKTIQFIKNAQLSFSLFTDGVDENADVLVLNTMGYLSKIYAYADVAYIGGGFNDGIHNCLEAAVYNIPVSFYGNSYTKYVEAEALEKIKAASAVYNENELSDLWKTTLTEEFKASIKSKIENYFSENSNATAKVLSEMQLK